MAAKKKKAAPPPEVIDPRARFYVFRSYTGGPSEGHTHHKSREEAEAEILRMRLAELKDFGADVAQYKIRQGKDFLHHPAQIREWHGDEYVKDHRL